MKCAVCFKKVIYLVFLPLISCTSVFYQPVKQEIFSFRKSNLIYKNLYIDTKDGENLHGWHFPAQKEEKEVKSKGLVLYFHGNAQNITSHVFNLFWLIEAGYDYVLFDYRAYGKSTGKISNKDMLNDIAAMYAYAKNYANQENLKLILFGQSLGGTLLLKYLSKNQITDYSDLIIEASFYSFQEIAERKAEKVWFLWPFQWLIPIIISDYNSLNAKELKSLTTKKVLIHSKNDPVVPFSQGQKIYKKIAEPKEFWAYEYKSHTGGTRFNNGEFAKKLLKRWQN